MEWKNSTILLLDGSGKVGERVDVDVRSESVSADLKKKPSLNSVTMGGEAASSVEFV